MDRPILLALGIVAAGLLLVVLPVVIDTYSRFRGMKFVRCPEKGQRAFIAVDAGHAALTSAVGRADLRITSCTRWPGPEECDRDCLGQVR